MLSKEHHIPDLNDFCNLLRKSGLKATSQRLAVHSAMMEKRHASADMVCEWILENSDTKITVASVYNTLSQMARMGIYNYRMSANNKMYFDVIPTPHFHLYDCVNHQFLDVLDDNLHQEIMDWIGQRRFKGYNIEQLDIQFIAHPTRKKRSRQQ